MKTKNIILISITAGMTGAIIFFAVLFTIFHSSNKVARTFDEHDFLPVIYAGNDSNTFQGTSTDFTEAAAMAVPAVVHIKTMSVQRGYYSDFFSPFFDFFGDRHAFEYPVTGAGSGVIVRSDGYIVTNHHVIANAEKIIVTLNDKRQYDADLVGYDPDTDLALLKIAETDLPFLVFGNSDRLKVGEWILTVGNPFNLTSTVTAGIVSAKARNIGIKRGRAPIESLIQTDAAINRGNSGGALVNLSGNLVGILTAIATGTGYYTGYSFAIPSNIVKKVVEDLIRFGAVQRAFLGISVIEITADFAKQNNIKDIKGLYVAKVEQGSAAEASGISVQDIILSIEGEEINSNARLLEIMGNKRPGDTMEMIISSKNKTRNIKVTLKGIDGTTEIVKKDTKSEKIYFLDATFKTLSVYELKKLNITHGVQITKLQDGKLRQAGIKEGFIIMYINGTTVRNAADIQNAIENTIGGVLIEGIYPDGMEAIYGFGL